MARLPISSYAGPLVALLAAIVGVALFSWAVIGMPGSDLRDLIVFLTASGGGSILIGYALISAAPRFGLGGVRPRLLLAHLVVLAIAFANIVVTAWLMFISPHDLGLLGLLLAFSAVVAVRVRRADRRAGAASRPRDRRRRPAGGRRRARRPRGRRTARTSSPASPATST